jgi:hypothetical protein
LTSCARFFRAVALKINPRLPVALLKAMQADWIDSKRLQP